MQDVLAMMDTLKRPGLLVRAAILGAENYRRKPHLQRVLGYGQVPRNADALMRLMQIETEMNEKRKSEDAGYLLADHLDALIAMLGEARILRASQKSRQAKEGRLT